jgi:hypothetical protein
MRILGININSMHENIFDPIGIDSNFKNPWNLPYIPHYFYVFHQYLMPNDYIEFIFVNEVFWISWGWVFYYLRAIEHS